MTNLNYRGVLGAACIIAATFLAPVNPAVADIYEGNPAAFDFTISAGTTGPTFDIDTDAGTTNPATVSGVLDSGVMVFRFNNLTVANDVTITVTGSNPLSIAAAGDLEWAADISVADGVAGGGAGGAAGSGGHRLGGTAGPGGSGGNGGAGQGRASGSDGANGGSGSAGEAGENGGDGSLGFGAAGSVATGGIGGNEGAASGVSTNRGFGATATGGGGALGTGANNGDANPGTAASQSGVPGSAGQFGSNGGNGLPGSQGSDADFTASASDLVLAAGNGGGGGGGGGQGGGGQGGGQGGGGSSGAGGGGGGGVNGSANGSCTSSDAPGGKGGDGGAGGAGGDGGNGGSALPAGDGGEGANGGGAIVIAAKGLLVFSGQVDISAGTRGTGTAGAGTVAGLAGAPGGTAEADSGFTAPGGSGTAQGANGCSGFDVLSPCNTFQGCPSINSYTSGAGGAGTLGADGGAGGTGASSGTSAAGGDGGYGTPGMAKLQGSVVQASSGTILAGNAAGALASQNGKFTLISNMRAADVTSNSPTLLSPGTVPGDTTNDAVLTGPAVYNAGTTLPVIPQLVGELDTHGILQSSFYNSGVSRTLVSSTANVDITRIPDASTVFDGFDQLFVENTTGGTISGQGLIIGAFPAITLPDLGPGEIWTTHVAPGTGATGVNSLTITTQPVGGDRYVGENISLTVAATGGNPTVSYQWQLNEVDITLGQNATAQSATLVLNALTLADAGDYRCVVTDDGALASPGTSNVATVTVYEHLAAAIQPEGGVRFSSPPDTFTFYFGTTGGFQSVTYTWTKDSVPVQTGASPVYFISPVTAADAGVYECTAVDDGTDTVVSNTATLVVDPLGIAQQPESVLVVAGDEARLEVVVEGGVGAVNYQWYEEDGSKAEVEVPGATTNELVYNPATVGDSGLYFCRVTDNATSIDSSAASIVVATPLQIIGQPASVTVNEGATVSFAVTTNGGQGPINYIWKYAGNPIPSAPNSAVYTINAVGQGDAGLYSCDVSDNVASLSSTDAALGVESSVPATDYRGLAVLLALCLGAGVLLLRRSRKAIQ